MVRTMVISLLGVWVLSLIGELGAHKPGSMEKKKKNQKTKKGLWYSPWELKEGRYSMVKIHWAVFLFCSCP